MAGYDTRHRLPEIELPTLLIWGARDRLVPLKAAYAYRKRMEHADISILDDTGHMLQIERPESFNAELASFVSRHEPRGEALLPPPRPGG
jgi:2-hydroxy-6-oxonona-2,4-dienedioate hydrolase/4,5:9,10-diseco-3-hydroxy-5,9,17-trioxoandrosta-1(10),2-diene-4-oate hydrolase